MPFTRTFLAHQLTVGDRVRVHVQGDPTLVVADVLGFNPDGGAPILGGNHVVSVPGDRTYEIVRFANGLPNAVAVAWRDDDRNDHIALQSGHPLNHGWDYNGVRLNADELIRMIGTSKPAALDFVDVP